MVSHLPHFHPSPWEVVSSQPPLYPSTPQPLPLWLYVPAKAGDTVVAISTTTSAAVTKTLAMRFKILHLLSHKPQSCYAVTSGGATKIGRESRIIRARRLVKLI